jgi:hypothetical protein
MHFKITGIEEIFSGVGEAPSVYTHEFTAITLNEVIPELEPFLRGCGYYLNLEWNNEQN